MSRTKPFLILPVLIIMCGLVLCGCGSGNENKGGNTNNTEISLSSSNIDSYFLIEVECLDKGNYSPLQIKPVRFNYKLTLKDEYKYIVDNAKSDETIIIEFEIKAYNKPAHSGLVPKDKYSVTLTKQNNYNIDSHDGVFNLVIGFDENKSHNFDISIIGVDGKIYI